MRGGLLLIFIMYSCATALSQEFSYRHYDGKDGLAGAVVYCAAEDKEGFLWFGTETGLSRFDGTAFHNFTTADGLPDNEVLKLFVDSRNRIWMIPFSNSVCYYHKGRIYNADNDPVLRQLSIGSDTYAIQEDKYGNVIILEARAINIISPAGKVRKITYLDGVRPLASQGGGLNRDGIFSFFAAANEHLNIYSLPNPDNGAPVLQKETPFSSSVRGNSINTTMISPNVNVSRQKKNLFFLPASGKAFALPLPKNIVSISRIDDSLFAMNSTGGTIVYNLNTKSRVASFLEGQTVNAVIRDSESNLWFMCAGSGIFRVASMDYKTFRLSENGNDLSACSIRKIGPSVYVGTEKYFLWIIDPLRQKIRMQRIDGYAPGQGRILAILPYGRNGLVLGTDGGILRLVNFVKRVAIPSLSIKSVTETGKDSFLVSGSGNVCFIRGSDLKILEELWNARSTCSFRSDTLVYIGTIRGLYTITPGGKIHFLGDVDPFFKRRIADIKASPDGSLWIATNGGGVAYYTNGRPLHVLTEKDGLTSNTCRNIFVSGEEVWIGTDKGLNRVRRQNGGFNVTKFSSADGLSSDIVNAVYVDKDNVYVGTARGLTCFNSGKIADQSSCMLRVTAIRTTCHAWAYDTTNLLLPHRENSMRVEFVGISYRSAGDITYRYRLLGLSNAWRTTRETMLSYPTLPSGNYELQITATNKFGMQSGMTHITFTVQKLLWEETWFILLMAALISALVWFFVSLRIRRLKREAREKIQASKRMAGLEQMALRAQMNPHFIFNSLNSIQQYVIDKDFKGVNKFISGFSRLIRLTLEMSSKTVVSVEEEVKYLSTYLELEKDRFENKFDYHVWVDPRIDRLTTYIPSMSLQPYIENSIRHGVRNRKDNEGRISVRFTLDDQYLVSTVEDNGVGRKEAQRYKSQVPVEYQSRGMALTASRVEMFNKINLTSILINIEDLEKADGQPAGTRVTICFPLQEIIKPPYIHYDQSSDYRR